MAVKRIVANIAAEHELGHLGRLLGGAAVHGRRLGLGLGVGLDAAGEHRHEDHDRKGSAERCHRVSQSMSR